LQVLSKETQVNTFLESIGRNSINSRRTYKIGLTHFAEFLKPKKQTPTTIIPLLAKGKVNTYELLDQFVSYLSKLNIAIPSLKLYVNAIKSYLQFNDIDIVSSKFRRRVKLPKYYPDPEDPLSLSDIRELLEFNSNHRLRTYILLLVSTGLRAMEAASLRLMDVDFKTTPTTIHIRKEITKTKRGRMIYCSDETKKHILKLMEIHKTKQPEHFLFAVRADTKTQRAIYLRLLEQFERLQHLANMDQRKENSKRRKITLHSFRRTAFSIINEQTNSEFANWFLGHNHSVYWTHKEQERREIYRTKCMPFLTIYQDTRDNTIEDALREKDQTIKLLTNRIADIELQQKETSEILRHLTPEKLQKIINS
jgi:integrase